MDPVLLWRILSPYYIQFGTKLRWSISYLSYLYQRPNFCWNVHIHAYALFETVEKSYTSIGVWDMCRGAVGSWGEKRG